MTRIVMFAVALAPALAHAEPAPTLADDDDWGARSRVTGTLGLFTPVGEIGVQYTQALGQVAEVELGVGYGFSGPQASVMPRLRLGRGVFALTAGVGASAGNYVEPTLLCFNDDGCTSTRTTALWGNAEVGMQVTTRQGLTVHVYGGAGWLLAHDRCDGPHCDGLQGSVLPFLGVSVGHTI